MTRITVAVKLAKTFVSARFPLLLEQRPYAAAAVVGLPRPGNEVEGRLAHAPQLLHAAGRDCFAAGPAERVRIGAAVAGSPFQPVRVAAAELPDMDQFRRHLAGGAQVLQDRRLRPVLRRVAP